MVQFNTIQKTQMWCTNAYNAWEKFFCETIVRMDQKKQYVSMGHTLGKWFTRFMRGARFLMGMVHRWNKALTLMLVIGICGKVERVWGSACLDFKRMEMEDAVCFMLIAFGAGLQDKGVPLVSLKGLLHFWKEAQRGNADKRYIMMTLSGRFNSLTTNGAHMRHHF